MNSIMDEAWTDGYDACRAGDMRSDCPYDEDYELDLYCQWMAGWSTSYKEMQELDGAIGTFDE